MLPLFELLHEKSSNIKPLTKEILEITSKNQLQMPLDSLMSSYLHMFCNRLFRSKQRLHELVVYNFLSAYYRSEIMKAKNMKAKQKSKIPV